MGYTLVTGPVGEPITLSQAKAQLRLDDAFTVDDSLLGLLITAARQYAEQETSRSLLTQQWRLTADQFDAQGMRLEKGPVQSIDAITYTAMDGSNQTMPLTDCATDLTGSVARITPKFGKVWPIPMLQIASVQILFTAGYGSVALVPQGITQWMLLRLAAMYENREEFVTGRGIVCTPLPFFDRLLDAYRILRA